MNNKRSITPPKTVNLDCDIAICGAGLAGLTLARQLHLEQPQRRVVLVDQLARPLPDTLFKPGESTVELGAHYLAKHLQLADYLQTSHFPKLGLRYFIGDGHRPLQDRPEIGLSEFPTIESSYQIDRSVFESDLRDWVQQAGVELLEGYRVKNITLAQDNRCHNVIVESIDRTQIVNIHTRWVIDALGRRRLLQRKLGLTKPVHKKHSAVWFRIEGRFDIDQLVPSTETEWHQRTQDDRYYSTTHLMGRGYWVWLIPLAPHRTSIGIVAQEERYPFNEFNTYEKALVWLGVHEPALAKVLQPVTPIDFRAIRRYSYSSKQVFSEQRWACVGEAGVFSDPYYSPGTDMIGFSNMITTEMIRLDFEDHCGKEQHTHLSNKHAKDGDLAQDRPALPQKLTPALVQGYNRFYLGFNDTLTTNIQAGYSLFDNPVVTAAKTIWDFTAAWAFACPQMFHTLFLDSKESTQFRHTTAPFFYLSRRMHKLFFDWEKQSKHRLTFDFLDYLFSLDFLNELRSRNLQHDKDLAEVLADQKENIARIEELAQAIFLLALEDTMPETLDSLPDPLWFNAWRVSLNPQQWERDGLFQPKTAPRDFTPIWTQLRSQFQYTTHLKTDSSSLSKTFNPPFKAPVTGAVS